MNPRRQFKLRHCLLLTVVAIIIVVVHHELYIHRLTDKDLPPGYSVVCDGCGHFTFRDAGGYIHAYKVVDSRGDAIDRAITDADENKTFTAEKPPSYDWHDCRGEK